jgi:hypothetical protein
MELNVVEVTWIEFAQDKLQLLPVVTKEMQDRLKLSA